MPTEQQQHHHPTNTMLNDEATAAAAPDVDALVAKMSAHRIIKSLPLRTGSETSSLAARSSSSCPSHYSPRSSSPSPPPQDSWSSSLTSPDASTGPQSARQSFKLGGVDAQHRQHTNLVAAAAALVLPYWPRNREAQELALFRMSGVGPKAILDHLEREARARGGANDRRPSHHHYHNHGSTGAIASATTRSHTRATSPPSSDHWPASSSMSKKRKNSLDGEATRVRDRDFEVFSDVGSEDVGGTGSVEGDDAPMERPDVSSRTFRASRLVDEIASGHVDCGCSGGVDAAYDKPSALWPSSRHQHRSSSSETPWSTRWRSVLAKTVRSRLACQRAAGPLPPTPPPPLAGQTGQASGPAGGTAPPTKAKVSRAERRAMALKGKGGQKMTLAQLKAQRSGGASATAATATTAAPAAVKGAPASSAAASTPPAAAKVTPPSTQFTFSIPTPLTSILAEARQRLSHLLTQPVADVVTALDLPRPVFDEEEEEEDDEADGEGEGEEDNDGPEEAGGANGRRSNGYAGRDAPASGGGGNTNGNKSSPLREAYFSIPSTRVPMLYPWADTQRTPKWRQPPPSQSQSQSQSQAQAQAQTQPRAKNTGNMDKKSNDWPPLAQGWPLPWRDGKGKPFKMSVEPAPVGTPGIPFGVAPSKEQSLFKGSTNAPAAAATAAVPGAGGTATTPAPPPPPPTPASANKSPPIPTKLTRRQKARINNVHHAVNSHRWMPSGATGGRDASAQAHDDGAYTHGHSHGAAPHHQHNGADFFASGGGAIPGLALDDFCVYCDYIHLYGEAPRFWPGGPCRHRCPERVGPVAAGLVGRRGKKGKKGKGGVRKKEQQLEVEAEGHNGQEDEVK